MASQTEVCNRALTKLGADAITSLSDNKVGARTLTLLWDSCRKAELSKRYWNFALARASLAALSDVPPFQFGTKYQLPVDFLKPVMVGDFYCAPGLQDYRNQDDSPYAIEGKQLLTDFGAPLNLRYVSDVTDPGAFDALFVEVLASKLAYEGCYKITQSRQGQEQASADYKAAIKDAALANAIARPPQGLPDDSWILGRV